MLQAVVPLSVAAARRVAAILDKARANKEAIDIAEGDFAGFKNFRHFHRLQLVCRVSTHDAASDWRSSVEYDT